MSDALTIETLPIGYFLNTWQSVKKATAGAVLVMLRGKIHGYLSFREDADAIASAIHIPIYKQKVLNQTGTVPYCFIPDERLEEAMDTIDNFGLTMADRTPEEGITYMEILPLVQQMSLF